MGMYKHMRKLWNKGDNSELKAKRLKEWRKQDATVRIKRPTRLDRARSLGYKAKPGIIVVRQRVRRGGRQRPQFKAGRRSKHFGRRKIVTKSYQQIAEEKAAKKFTNCEVLNSYFVIKDGKNYWFEIILLDRFHPQVQADPKLKSVAMKKGRAERGLTRSGKKSRGL